MLNKAVDNWKKFTTKTILESNQSSLKSAQDLRSDGYYLTLKSDYPEYPAYSPFIIEMLDWKDNVVGSFEFGPTPECKGVIVAYWTDLVRSGIYLRGYGPLIYDLAMEIATESGMSLASDRETISEQAIEVWNKYLNARKGDVKANFLDDCPVPELSEELFPEPTENPCHYSYTKKGNLRQQLEGQGLLKVVESDALMENLLKEGMKDVSDLPEGIGIEVGYKEDKWISAYYIYLDTDKMVHKSDKENPHGYAFAEKASNSSLNLGPCANAYVISSTEAQQGWGPLLYDVIMEIATSKAGGLTSDRIEVSSDANRIWKKYTKREDVDSMNLDNPNNEMTPPTIDNCVQISTKAHNKDWWDTPLSKVYRKPIADKLTELISSGKIRFVEKLRWKSEMNPSYLPGEL